MLLGSVPFVRDNIDMLAIVIVLVSVLPVAIGAYARWRREKSEPEAERVPAGERSRLD